MRGGKALGPLAVLAAAAASFFAWERLSFDRQGWLADYDQLRAHVARNYANLLWVVEHRDLDPAALHRTTREKLESAATDRAARAAIAGFVSSFQDAHFRIARTPLSDRLENLFSTEAVEIASGTPANKACAALGFSNEGEGLAFTGPGITPLPSPDNSFPAAVLQSGGKAAGLIRIPIFDQKRYRPACERAWRARGERPCDKACVETFINAAVPNQLLAELTAQVTALAHTGARLLVVDVTGNGGGTDWAEPAARIIAKTPLACAQVSFTRGPHWMKAFSEMAQRIDKDLAASGNSGDIALLQVARRRALDFADAASVACPLDGLWTGAERPNCSNLIAGTSYSACGLMGPLPKGSLSRAESRDALFLGLGYDYPEGVFDGPVAVLIDGGTASAAEYFAAILADNKAATLVGQRTYGVGCGYTNGGVGILLAHSGMRIEMPDCQRLRADGANELAGVAPEIPVDWKDGDSDADRAAKLAAALAPLIRE